MTPLILLDELCAELTGLVKNCLLDTKSGEKVSPKVTPGYLSNIDDGKSVFPYVIPRIINVVDEEEETIVKVVIIIGTRAEDEGFWRDCWNVAERIRQGLLIQPTVGNKFRLRKPLKIEGPDHETQPYPEAVCWITTFWTIPQPIEEVDYGDNI